MSIIFGLRYDTPVYAVEVIVSNHLKNIGKWGVITLLFHMLIDQKNRTASKYILAESLQTATVQDFIDELNLPFVPFFVKRFTKRYAISGNNVGGRKEHIIYLLSALQVQGGADLLNKMVDCDISDSFYWLLNKKLRHSSLMIKAVETEKILLAESLAHNGAGRRGHMKSLLYWSIQREFDDIERSSRTLRVVISHLKNELAWLELIELYDWLDKHNIRMDTESQMDVAWVLFQFGDYEKSQNIYQSTWEESGDEESFRKQARCLEREGKWNKAIKLICSRVFNLSSTYAKAKLLRTLGWCYIIAGEERAAIKVSKEAIQIFSEIRPKSKDLDYNLARSYNNLGAAYELADNLNLSAYYHDQSLGIMKRLRVWKWVSGSALNKSIVLRKKGDLKASLKGIALAKKIKHAIMDFDEMPVILFNEGLTLIRLFLREDSPPKLLRLAGESLATALRLREQQNSNKQVPAILSLGYILSYLSQGRITPEKNITTLQNKFLQCIQIELMETYERDKQPMIAKAILLRNHSEQKNDYHNDSLSMLEKREAELPTVKSLALREI